MAIKYGKEFLEMSLHGIVDCSTLSEVLEALAVVCDDKAKVLADNDEMPRYRCWASFASIIRKANEDCKDNGFPIA